MRQAERLTAVEDAIRGQPWTEALVLDLMSKTGASRATLYRDRQVVLRKLADEERAGLEERRAAFLLDLRRLREEARVEQDYAPAARLLDMEAKILGLDRVPLPEVEAEDPAAPVDTSLETVLREVRRLRRQAQAGHSYVAAEKLLEREAALVESIRQRDEAAAARDLAHLDEEAKVGMVAELIRGLPDTLRKRVLESL